jgi:phytanoyl-CoA hydroxylase
MFDEQGFVVIEDVLSAHNIRALRDDYEALLDRLAVRFYEDGKIPSTFDDLPFEKRLTAIMTQSSENLYKYFDISLNLADPTGPMHLSEAVFNLIRHPRILDTVESLIGGEILANPIQHVRIKPPQLEAVHNRQQSTLLLQTGWHQDLGVTRQEADNTDMITVWVAITDATEENGCLTVIPGSHRTGLEIHCPTNQMTIPDTLLNGVPTALPMKAGSAIFMHRLTKHASLPNVSDSIRWSFDLRYQPIGQPTGRDEFPAFVARSRTNPASELHDFEAWRQLWADARSAILEAEQERKTHRWDGDAPVCA